ncbi:chemoreceptor glutamine deamidase [Methanocaldococcus bathoardescens]|uniref:Probable chemoreceptor glutamine deamidase CheD n=1 Tax=Methanocaldococcus bathoardescens TaxID=1301915 RepID=A0A076LJM6_9EURY|nr:chemotaxis protein CheD [Methanocaldococcus bathoardescens]AIJ05774.1 chemoreceptor glutamine deamidase [Methanocaldococcus bathoardescens]
MVIKVRIGGLEVARSPEVLETLLGSCVAIMLYDTGKRIGGMAHSVLPETRDENVRDPGKYVNTAIPALITKMTIAGARANKLVAKLAGGAAMFKTNNSMNIGAKNVEMAKKLLKQYGIPLKGEDTGGNRSRIVKFYLRDGKVEVKKGGQIITI